MEKSRNENMKLVEKAFIFAAVAHSGSYRKGSEIPYIVHPIEVAFITAGITDDSEVIAAAVLHDVVEDTEYTLEDIRREFGDRVASLVDSESENKREEMSPEDSWKIRKQETIDHMKTASFDTKIIALSDKLSNIRSVRKDLKNSGSDYWDRFHQKDPKEHAWYYYSMLYAMRELEETKEWKEYKEICDEIFGSYRD